VPEESRRQRDTTEFIDLLQSLDATYLESVRLFSCFSFPPGFGPLTLDSPAVYDLA
jgi:hypothetical protein